jgi:hypothetical protein
MERWDTVSESADMAEILTGLAADAFSAASADGLLELDAEVQRVDAEGVAVLRQGEPGVGQRFDEWGQRELNIFDGEVEAGGDGGEGDAGGAEDGAADALLQVVLLDVLFGGEERRGWDAECGGDAAEG